MSRAWEKLRAVGFVYAARFKVVAPVSAFLRGRFTSLWLSKTGPALRAHGSVSVQRDAGSVIALGARCDLHPGVSLISIRGHALAKPGHLSIGDDCQVKKESMLLAKSARLTVGNRCSVGRYTEISCEDVDLTIGNDVRIATQVWMGTGNHVFRDADKPIVEQGAEQHPITVEDDVWIGTHAVILPGVTLGRGAVVAAGAVVTKSVPPFSIVAGVPARVVKSRQTGSGTS